MAPQRLLQLSHAPVEPAERRGDLVAQWPEVRVDGNACEGRVAHVLRGGGAVAPAGVLDVCPQLVGEADRRLMYGLTPRRAGT